MIKIILFLFIFQMSLSNQTHLNEDSASVPVHVNVFVTYPNQQLKIVDKEGTQKDSIIINHFLSPSFQGENIEISDFYIQRGTGSPEQVLSQGVMEIIVNEKISLNGIEENALNVKIQVEKSEIETKNGQTRIKNTLTSKVTRNIEKELKPNDNYSATTNLNVIWKKY